MPYDESIPWDLVAQVRRSDRKQFIVKRLAKDPASATNLADEMGLKRGTVSNYFYELKSMDPPIVECITPDQPHHRLYALTDWGELIVDHI